MDLETLLIVACCLFVYIGIPALMVRHRKKKKAKAAEAAKKEKAASLSASTKKSMGESREKAGKDATKKTEPPKKTPAKTETPKKEPGKKETDKKPVSRVKTDPAFSGGGDLSREKPKPAPEKKKAPAKPQTDMEQETLLRLDRRNHDDWKCHFCGAENGKSAGRCVVCGEEKHPTGI